MARRGATAARADKLAITVATVLGIGRFPFAPGTICSAATVAVYSLLAWLNGGISPSYHVLFILLLLAAGIAAADGTARLWGRPDPSEVVIDEAIGQLVALFLVPISLAWIVAAFFLFRFFDVFKPFPIRRLERLPGGLGIAIDDVAAGIYANIVLQIFLSLSASR